MQMVVVAGFVLVMEFMSGQAAAVACTPGWVLLPAAAGYAVASLAGACWVARTFLRRLMHGRCVGRGPAIWSVLLQAFIVGGLAALLLGGWGQLLADLPVVGGAPLLPKLLALLPFAGALAAYWWGVYPLERALRDRARLEAALRGGEILPLWSRRRYLWFNVRHHLLFVAGPASAIILLLDALESLHPMLPAAALWPAGVVGGGTIFLLAPCMIVRIWDTRPLPGGPLRQRLQAFCRRIGLTCRDMLVWNTASAVANAGVMGIVRPARYVLLSDALLERMDPDALEAVLAHEAGHVVGHHILHLVVMTVGVLSLVTSAWWLSAKAAGLPVVLWEWPGALLAVAAWAVVFGLVSRRLERQSDVFAAWAVGPAAPSSGPAGSTSVRPMQAAPGQAQAAQGEGDTLAPQAVALFSRALLAVGRMNGHDPTTRNFRHGSIEDRLRYLAHLSDTGRGRRFEDRKVARLKVAIWLLLAAGLAAGLLAARAGG